MIWCLSILKIRSVVVVVVPILQLLATEFFDLTKEPLVALFDAFLEVPDRTDLAIADCATEPDTI